MPLRCFWQRGRGTPADKVDLGKYCDPNDERCDPIDAEDNNWEPPPARVTVAPAPLPLGWVYGPYTMCGDPPRCSMGVVNVQADGLNVRVVPNGPPVMSLVNGVPLIPLQREGGWLLVAAACDLTPTWAWSWTAGVPLNRCWGTSNEKSSAWVNRRLSLPQSSSASRLTALGPAHGSRHCRLLPRPTSPL